ncbi:MAG: nucleotide exchange factor GrpE [Nitrososphaeria archaeon]
MIEDQTRANLVIQSLRKKLGEEVKKEKELKDAYLYLLSDFENYKRRSENALLHCKDEGKAEMLIRISPALDEVFAFMEALERSLGKQSELYKGFEMIVQKMMKALKEEGFEVIDPLEKPFDPNTCSIAYTESVSDDKLKGTVIKVLSKGYIHRGKVIKPATVVVGV